MRPLAIAAPLKPGLRKEMNKLDYLYTTGLAFETNSITGVIASEAPDGSFVLSTVGKGVTSGIGLDETFETLDELLVAMKTIQSDLRKWYPVDVEA